MSDQLIKHFKEINRREFLVASLGAGVVALVPASWLFTGGRALPHRSSAAYHRNWRKLLRTPDQGAATDRGRNQQTWRIFG